MSFLQTDHKLAARCLNEAVELLDVEGNETGSEYASGTYGRGAGLARWQTRRVVAYIDANLGSRLKVSKLAALLPLSPTHFSRGFHRAMGCTPSEYIAAKRVEHAKSLLRSSAEPMCSIALMCGFADQPHFSKTFRRRAGVTPSAWRRFHGTDQVSHNEPAGNHQPLILAQVATVSWPSPTTTS
jgi:AraC family transcriptional regulator